MKKSLQTYHILTFGCQMNVSDSERFSAYLEGVGLTQVDHFQKADLIILNTCSVKQKAENRINGVVNNIRSLTKDTNPTIVVTGCMARRIWDEEKNFSNSSQKSSSKRANELKQSFPLVDIVVETKYFSSIGSLLGFKPKFNENPEHYLSFKPKYKSNFQAFIPISTGCNHFCTFCIVPFSRGKEICRPSEEIIREVFDLVKAGFKDITLLGQTVNRWINPDFQSEFDYNEAMTYIEGLNKVRMTDYELRVWHKFFTAKLNNDESAELEFSDNLAQPKDFLQLLQVLDQIPGQWWTTWVSSHPNYMTNELIEFVGESVKSSFYFNKENNLSENSSSAGHQRPYLHFALQSGSNNMLKRMNRRHSIEEFSKIVHKMDQEIPGLSLSTDIIVGFIGETEDDFNETLKAENELKFDMMYISEYSPRKGTAAARIKDNVPIEVKSKRKIVLNDLLKKVAFEKNEKLIGTKRLVLIDGIDKKTGKLTARTSHNKLVRLESKDESLIGTFAMCELKNCSAWAFEAILS